MANEGICETTMMDNDKFYAKCIITLQEGVDAAKVFIGKSVNYNFNALMPVGKIVGVEQHPTQKDAVYLIMEIDKKYVNKVNHLSVNAHIDIPTIEWKSVDLAAASE